MFVSLWKLYILTLLNNAFTSYGIEGRDAETLRAHLSREGLADANKSLGAYVQSALEYVRSFFHREMESVEAGMNFDTTTQLPTGVSGKITFREPGPKQRAQGFVSIDHLFKMANSAAEEANFNFWILLDRLDVAFDQRSDLEQHALGSGPIDFRIGA